MYDSTLDFLSESDEQGDARHSAVVICTRNRPADLARTLESISTQSGATLRPVFIVDASDARERTENAETIAGLQVNGLPVSHVGFDREPGLAKQRNHALTMLPDDSRIVHFLDDDVTLHAGYLQAIEAFFRHNEDVGGVGGLVRQPSEARFGTRRGMFWRRLFLLDHDKPGRVLASGTATAAQIRPLDERMDVEWLCGCSSFRRDLVDSHRFDEGLRGYSLDEDLDFSFRIGAAARLVVEPQAALTHHVSPTNRYDAERMAREAIVHRYWFLEKNIRHPLRKPAFWWAAFGRVVAATASRHPNARASRRGLVSGLHIIRRRDHPLLRKTSID